MTIPINNKLEKLDWIPALTGVRGIAIIMVLIGHLFIFHKNIFGYKYIIQFGSMGVDFFFVLSGYLITKILTDAKKTSSHFFLYFYIRRILRIFPIYYLTLAFLFLIIPWAPAGINSLIISSYAPVKIWFFTFLANWFEFYNEYPSPYFGHLWSLFVEEQFYILWPFCIRFIKLKKLFYGTSFLIILIAMLRFFILFKSDDARLQYQVYCSTLTRADALLFGSLVYFLLSNQKIMLWIRQNLNSFWAQTFFFFILLAALVIRNEQSSFYFLSFSLSSLLFSLCLIKIISDPSSHLTKFLNNKYLLHFGTISYSLYLIHWPIFCFFNSDLKLSQNFASSISEGLASLLLALVGLILSILIATLTWKFIENPFLALKKKFP